MAKRYRIADLKLIIHELVDENDRARALVGGSLIDGLLDYAITARLMQVTSGEESRLFKPGGPFHACDQKIQAAYALGLFGPKARKDMECINEIRNIFAHNMNPVSFEDQEIETLCYSLRISRGIGIAMSSKDRFIFSVGNLMEGLLNDADQRPQNKLAPIKGELAD